MKPRNQLEIGSRHGCWTVLDGQRVTGGHFYQLCECMCGAQHWRRPSKIRLYNKRCGECRNKTGNQSLYWKGTGDLPGSYVTEIKNRSKRKEIEYNVSIEYLWELFLLQNKKCALSNINLKFPSGNRTFDGTASLDRIDSSKGYIEGNVQWVHKDINSMKWDIPQDEFIARCRQVVNNDNTKKRAVKKHAKQ